MMIPINQILMPSLAIVRSILVHRDAVLPRIPIKESDRLECNILAEYVYQPIVALQHVHRLDKYCNIMCHLSCLEFSCSALELSLVPELKGSAILSFSGFRFFRQSVLKYSSWDIPSQFDIRHQ